MLQSKKNIRSYVMDFQEQLLLSKSSLDEDTKMIIFRKGLSHTLQDKLIGLKSNVPGKRVAQTGESRTPKTHQKADFWRLNILTTA
jgi:hypothetical protein